MKNLLLFFLLLTSIVSIASPNSVTLKAEKQHFEMSVSVKKFDAQKLVVIQKQKLQLKEVNRQFHQNFRESQTPKTFINFDTGFSEEKIEVGDDDDEPYSNYTLCDNDLQEAVIFNVLSSSPYFSCLETRKVTKEIQEFLNSLSLKQ